MKQQKTNLPVLSRVGEVGIPARKLNTIEQRNYRNYAQQVCEKIKTMLLAVKAIVLKKYEDDNRDKIIAELVKEYKVTPIVAEVNDILSKIKAANDKSKAIVRSHEVKLAKLETERDLALAELKDKSMSPLVEEWSKLNDKLQKNPSIRIPFEQSMKIYTAKEYEYDYDEDDDRDSLLISRKRTLNLSYPAINITNIVPAGSIAPSAFIRITAIDNKLNDIMKEAKDEFSIAELKLESMEQAVQEVMMFDEARMNEAFEKLLKFRDSIQEKYIQVVKGIDPSELDKGGV